MPHRHTWYEFFAGGGMARLGLGKQWNCTFANEWCGKKTTAYRAHFGRCDELKEDDVADVTTRDLPGTADLAWASFPCQDLSLAGMGAGLDGNHSGSFKPFWRLISKLVDEGRAPEIITLENVVGAITSHNGRDFEALLAFLVNGGYRAGAMIVDAVRFLPQSRPRLFVVAVRQNRTVTPDLYLRQPNIAWHPPSLRRAYAALPSRIQEHWMWWNLPEPSAPIKKISGLIERNPVGVRWHTKEQTRRLLGMMSEVNTAKLHEVQAYGEPIIGTVYKRTRADSNGRKVQRAEVRFDGISGCLRTPTGGSSRQTVLVVQGESVSSRLLSPREAARLMGLPEDYPIPANYNEAYHLFGDGVAVPVVAWLEEHLLRPLISKSASQISEYVA